MGSPAAVMNDRIVGTCAIHQVPNPASGVPQPGPPMPFAAPLLLALEPSVQIGGKPVAVMGSSGHNTPPHVLLHATDPFMLPMLQEGRVLSGSATVLAGSKPLANAQSSVTCCATPGQLVATGATVLVG
jgi:hypothetical protein